MTTPDPSKDFYTLNKDELLSISIFISLKQLDTLCKTSKKVNQWLRDPLSFSWKKRIEMAFPTTFKAVLLEDMKDQIAKLQKFDTLVDEGHQVSFFSLPSLLDVASVEVNFKYQIPWNRTLFLIVYNKTSALVFDAVSGKDISRVDLGEMLIDNVLFDVHNHKVGFVNGGTGLMKFHSFENNELKFVTDYTSEKLKSDLTRRNWGSEELVQQIYGDNIIARRYSQLMWYSLSSGNIVKEFELPGIDGIYLAASVVKPELYVSQTNDDGDLYRIRKIDCTLQATEPMEKLYQAELGIDYENGGDGVAGLKLIETEHGRILNIPLLGTGDTAFQAYDVDDGEIVESLHFDETQAYKTIQYNPGSDFYSVRNDSDAVAIMETDEMYEENNISEEAQDNAEDEYERSDPAEGAYFKFKTDVQNHKWLNKDLFTLNTVIDDKPHCQFFSISKRAIIGSINEDIAGVFIAGKLIVAFTTASDIYRIKLDMDFDTTETENIDEEKMDVVKNEAHRDKYSANKKRKSSEMDTDEADEPPKKKSKSNCCQVS